MTALRHGLLRASILAIALVTATLPAARSDAQTFDCSGTAWTAATEADFESAVGCWDAAGDPGAYTITLTADIAGPVTIGTQSSDRSLLVAANGHSITERLTIAGDLDAPLADRSSPITVSNARLFGGISIGLAIVEVVDTSSEAVSIGRADVTLRRAIVGRDQNRNAVRASESRVLIVDSVVFGVRDDPAFLFEDSAVVVRNSIVHHNTGVFEHVDASEVLFDRSAVIDNDVNLLSMTSGACCTGSTFSYVNSTFAQDDGSVPFSVGIGAREQSLVQVANSTVLANGPHGLIGPVQTWSSLVDRCDEPDPNLPRESPAFLFSGEPVDNGGNVGGCFATSDLNHYPLADYGCAVPTAAGCVPTYATASGHVARSAGTCANTLVAAPVDLFDIDLASLQPGTGSVLTTMGTQLVDGRGFPRTSCDSGAYESDGSEPALPGALRVATIDLDHPLALDGAIEFDYGGYELATAIEAEAVDIVFAQRVLVGPYGDQLIEQTMGELRDLGWSMVHDYAPAVAASHPDDPYYSAGQLIFSRQPIVERGAVALANPEGLDTTIQYALVETASETIRLVNVRGYDEAPCSFVAALEDWLAEQPQLTTIIGGNLAADRPVGCVGEFAAGWVDACASPVADPSCARTMIDIVDGQLQDITNDFVLHRPVSGSTARLTSARVLPQPPGIFSDHLAVVADFDFSGDPADSDSDGVADAADNCPNVNEVSQGDIDGDGIGDACDPVLDGDANCDDTRDIIDALIIAQYDAGVRTDTASCTIANPATELYAYGADANNDGTTDIIDALLMAQCSASIENVACPPILEFD